MTMRIARVVTDDRQWERVVHGAWVPNLRLLGGIRMQRLQLSVVACAMACALAVGCDNQNDYDNDGFGDDADGDDTDVDEFLTDGEIAQILVSANESEIEVASAAQGRVTSPVASTFAENMIAAHVASGEDLEALLADSNIEPDPNEVASDIEAAAAFMIRQLNNATIGNVDRVFMEGQAQFHLDVKNLIEDELIAAANDNDLRDFLEAMLTDVTAHYNAAVAGIGDIEAE
jgi:predicted outer membrane protein